MRKHIKMLCVVLTTLVISIFPLMLAGCEDHSNDRPKSTLIEIYHPSINWQPNNGYTYYMTYDGEPKVFSVKIYCVQDKRYLTNDDMVRKDLNSLIVVTIRKNDETISTRIDISDPNAWPREVGEYGITLNFNSFIRDTRILDPNYYAAPMQYFTLVIEEEHKNV